MEYFALIIDPYWHSDTHIHVIVANLTVATNKKKKNERLPFSWVFFFFQLGYPNKMFRFPSPSTRKVGSVGRIKKNRNQKIISK